MVDDNDPTTELDEYEQEEQDYRDRVVNVDKSMAAKVMKIANEDGTLRRCIKARKSTFVSTLIHLDGKKFSFNGRDYLRPIYDQRDKQILLKTARQVEKCCHTASLITLANGEGIRADEIKPGMLVLAMDQSLKKTSDRVVASVSNGDKPCLQIKTKRGSLLEITYNHPLFTTSGWEVASNLKVGDKVASFKDEWVSAVWDEIDSIKEIGVLPTWALQTETQTFVSDSIINHNTTFLGNNLTINSVINPYNKALYVSPSHTQTRQFSNEKLKPAIEGSPHIKTYFQDSSVSTQVRR